MTPASNARCAALIALALAAPAPAGAADLPALLRRPQPSPDIEMMPRLAETGPVARRKPPPTLVAHVARLLLRGGAGSLHFASAPGWLNASVRAS